VLMNNIHCDAMVQVIRKIFEATRSQSPDNFQDYVLEEVKSLIPFDYCKWGTGVVQDDRATINALHLHNLPEHSARKYLKLQPQDPMLAKLIAERSKIVTFDRYEITPREQFIQLPIYQEYSQKYGLEQLISTMVPEPISNLFSVISFFRKNYDHPFSTAEKQIKTMITPVLTEARSHNILINMTQYDGRFGQFTAISDAKGILKEAERSFSLLMLEEWPEWQGPQLNLIPESLLNGQQTAVYRGRKVNIHISALHDQILLQIERKSVLDLLTSAEKKVSLLLVQGLADKQIATSLGISPKTVGHHLQHIYKKTAIPNRGLLMATLRNEA